METTRQEEQGTVTLSNGRQCEDEGTDVPAPATNWKGEITFMFIPFNIVRGLKALLRGPTEALAGNMVLLTCHYASTLSTE